MDRNQFEELKGKNVKVVLKPNAFRLDGTIDAVFEDCFQFRTAQGTSYIEFDAVMSIFVQEGR